MLVRVRTGVIMQKYDTFISYSHDDTTKALRIKEHLERRGFRVWNDFHLKRGDSFRAKIDEALLASRSVVTLLTERSLCSDAVYGEVKQSVREQKKVIPVVLSPKAFYRSERWTKLLRDIDWGRLRPDQSTIRLTERVLREIERALSNPSDRGCPILAFYNFKGGVGKTTLCSHLAAELFESKNHSKSVLMIDCDAQSNLSSLFISQKELRDLAARGRNLVGMLEPDRQRVGADFFEPFAFAGGVSNNISAYSSATVLYHDPRTDKNFSLVPCGVAAKKYGHLLDVEVHGRLFQNFQNSIQELSYEYDFIFIDCNPSSSPLSKFALDAATDIVVPFRCDKYATHGLSNIEPLLKDFYGLSFSYGSGAGKQLWTLANFARIGNLDVSNDELAEGADYEALVLKEILGQELLGAGGLSRFKASLLNTRVPDSGYLSPRPASTGPRYPGTNPAKIIRARLEQQRAERVAGALRKLAHELAEKVRQGESSIEAV